MKLVERRLVGSLLVAGLAAGANASAARVHRERGVASWYGHPFHGRKTASGEIFDMYARTAAHPTLPLSTDVEVTNLRNGRSVVVRINDRGPFVRGRVIDLSYASARAIGLVRAGTGPVEIRTVDRGSARAEFLQVGAYSRRANAERERRRLAAAGFENVAVTRGSVGRARIYRVRLGPVADPAVRARLIERLAGMGIVDAFPTADLVP